MAGAGVRGEVLLCALAANRMQRRETAPIPKRMPPELTCQICPPAAALCRTTGCVGLVSDGIILCLKSAPQYIGTDHEIWICIFGGDARQAVDYAVEVEAAGWDGFFVPDLVWGYDPWVMLAGAAVRTEKIRLGTMITPASRRRPWKLAGEVMTLDHLSNGRVILSVGLELDFRGVR